MICIKTGAMVLIEDYNAVVRADVFMSKNIVVVQYVGDMMYSHYEEVTHSVSLDDESYIHQDRNIVVVERKKMRIHNAADAAMAIINRPDLGVSKHRDVWITHEI